MATPSDFDVEDHIRGTLYGNCIGDAIGLLTEFMVKSEAKKYYGEIKDLEFHQKVSDFHRERWKNGDWTDDSDQMLLIMQSILDTGKISPVDYGAKLKNWARHGFQELGDFAGMGIGATTHHVLHHKDYDSNPHAAAEDIWVKSGRVVAPNGGVMRTSVLGVYQYENLDKVRDNTLDLCKVTHFDPRCQASCVAVTSAIALMLQRDPRFILKNGLYDIDSLIKECYQIAKPIVTDKKQRKELKEHMFATKLSSLKLEEFKKIGYTFKCMGAGFWALKQNDFREALTKITMEAGDADTNGAVAGALLGCKLGAKNLPSSWLNGLIHKEWLDGKIAVFLPLVLKNTEPHASSDTETPKMAHDDEK